MSLASFAKAQLGLMTAVEKAYETFKKSPKERLRKESYLLTRIESLDAKWNVIADNHRKLLEQEGIDETTYMKEDVFQAMEEMYIEYKSEMRDALSVMKSSKLPTSTQSSSYTASKIESSVRLPKISIPTFSGSYAEWTTFKDLYVSLIHNNSSIDDVQKMHYLKSQLSGEAEQLLRHVPITAASYEEAWSTLNSRYNNKKYLANCLLKRFMNQPSIGSQSSSAIKDMLDVMNETLNGLKNLGVSVSSWDTIVIYVVGSKLDSESRKEWELKISVSDELPTLDQLREFLQSRFRALEFMDPKPKTKPNSSNQRANVLHAVSTDSDAATQTFCPYCKKEEHKLANCKEFSTNSYDQRQNFVQTNSLCFNCLGRNHSAYICRAMSRCHICKRKHHSLLHPSQSPTSTSSALAKSELEGEVKSAIEQVKTTQDESSLSVKAHFSQNQGTRNQILLATAVVGAQADDNRSLLLRALVDQGSQASFVTESAVQALGLRKVFSKSNISGLGGDKGNLASKYIVTVKIQSRHDPSIQLQVRAHVLSKITSLLPSDKVEYVEWPELADVVLADPQFHTPSNIDILLGADVYGKIIKEGLMKGPNGTLIAQCTALGWILSGSTHNTHIDEAEDDQHCHHNVVVNMHACVDELLMKCGQVESDVGDSKILIEEVVEDPESETEKNELVRHTFDTAPAPYLALKTLQQIAVEEEMECPDGSELNGDDLLTGYHTIEDRKKILKEKINALSKEGFEMQKGVTNNKYLAAIVMNQQEIQDERVDEKNTDESKLKNMNDVRSTRGIKAKGDDSRGCIPMELSGSNLWLQGPVYLKGSDITYQTLKASTDREQGKIKVHLVVDSNESPGDPTLWPRFLKDKALETCIRQGQSESKDKLKPLRYYEPAFLSPEYFFIGESIVIIPERIYEQGYISFLRRWKVKEWCETFGEGGPTSI